MLSDTFLATMRDYFKLNPDKFAAATTLASTESIIGGWEGWLQAEIALCFNGLIPRWACEREYRYPAPTNGFLTPYGNVTGNERLAARCDFYLHRPESVQLPAAGTYVELKCIRPNGNSPLDDAWNAFAEDIDKIKLLRNTNNKLPCVALLATFGVFQQENVQTILKYYPPCRIWDPVKDEDNVTSLADVALGEPYRFFLVATSPGWA